MQYSQAIFRITADDSFVRDVLTQQLADAGFESFVVQPDGNLEAYIPSADLDITALNRLLNDFPFEGVSLSGTSVCEDKDWNEEWERNSFQPIRIGSDCLIHAPFHTNLPQCRYDIVINPKMAFGTGTHQTTSLILEELLTLAGEDGHSSNGTNLLQGKSLLDMGCGTAVLALLARKLGADPVTAIDIDDRCTENAKENCMLNGISDIEIMLGDARLLQGKAFDVIIANINRNILLMDMPRYANALKPNGMLLMSGFYKEDIPLLQQKAEQIGMQLVHTAIKDNWAMMRVMKN